VQSTDFSGNGSFAVNIGLEREIDKGIQYIEKNSRTQCSTGNLEICKTVSTFSYLFLYLLEMIG